MYYNPFAHISTPTFKWLDRWDDYLLYDTQNPNAWLSTDARVSLEAMR
jgi:hypothetical protein